MSSYYPYIAIVSQINFDFSFDPRVTHISLALFTRMLLHYFWPSPHPENNEEDDWKLKFKEEEEDYFKD